MNQGRMVVAGGQQTGQATVVVVDERCGLDSYMKPLLAEACAGLSKTVSFLLVSEDGVPGDRVRATGAKMPFIVDHANAVAVTGVNRIARFIAADGADATPDAMMKANAWSRFDSERLVPALAAGDIDATARVMESMETALEEAAYLSGGDAFGLGDVYVLCTLVCLSDTEDRSAFLKDIPRVAEWFDRMMSNRTVVIALSSAEGRRKMIVGGAAAGGEKNETDSGSNKKKNVPTKKDNGQAQGSQKKSGGASKKGPATPADADAIPEIPPVTVAQRNHAKKSFVPSDIKVTELAVHPILPLENRRNVMITSALPYVNNVPHLGNIIGCVLSADVYARYCRLRGDQVLYVCGTDEFGTATETKARAEGLTPQEICDKYHAIHADVYKWFNIGFDHFGRTTTPQQTEICHDIYKAVRKNNFIETKATNQLYDQEADMFLADRFVEGICPFCGYTEARGDQCDGCGKLLDATALLEPISKITGTKPILRESTHLFLKLGEVESEVKTWVRRQMKEGKWSMNGQSITEQWLTMGLQSRCITRDLKWGTPVPEDGFESKVFYVWFDAPIGYISMTACHTPEWKLWWKQPDNVEYYQFMGKDNVPFHSIVFPSSLLATKDKWTLVNHISTTEYLMYEGDKFSKSRGVGVFGNHCKETGIPAFVYRFYLLYCRPESADTNFTWADLTLKCNTELLNNLGNFINRALSFTAKRFDKKVPGIGDLTEDDFTFIANINLMLKSYNDSLANVQLRDGLKKVLTVSRLGNQYLQLNAPWKLISKPETKQRAATVVSLAVNVVHLLASIISPYMPSFSDAVAKQLNQPICNIPDVFTIAVPKGHVLGDTVPLVTKLEQDFVDGLREKYKGKADYPPPPP